MNNPRPILAKCIILATPFVVAMSADAKNFAPTLNVIKQVTLADSDAPWTFNKIPPSAVIGQAGAYISTSVPRKQFTIQTLAVKPSKELVELFSKTPAGNLTAAQIAQFSAADKSGQIGKAVSSIATAGKPDSDGGTPLKLDRIGLKPQLRTINGKKMFVFSQETNKSYPNPKDAKRKIILDEILCFAFVPVKDSLVQIYLLQDLCNVSSVSYTPNPQEFPSRDKEFLAQLNSLLWK